jgi:hypothetical protein
MRNTTALEMSIEGTHLHLLVEADSRAALSTGIQVFEISAAKHLRADLRVRGARREGGRARARARGLRDLSRDVVAAWPKRIGGRARATIGRRRKRLGRSRRVTERPALRAWGARRG